MPFPSHQKYSHWRNNSGAVLGGKDNLDSEGDEALTQAILGVRARGGIVIVVAHRPSAITSVDLILVLNKGRQHHFGPKEEVLAKWTPDAVEEACGVKEEQMLRVARMLHENKPGTIVWCMGQTQHTIGNAMVRASCIVNAGCAGITSVPQTPVRVIAHGRNLGQSRAVRTGVRSARNDLVVTLDGDGQNDPADIPKLVALYRAEAANPSFGMVAGERAKRQDTWRKRLASRLANRIRRRLLNYNAKDTGCGLKAFRREAFLALPYFDHMHRYLITLMLREGYEVRFVPVGHRPRGAGRSKYGVLDRLAVGISDLLGVMWLKRRFRGPDETKEL